MIGELKQDKLDLPKDNKEQAQESLNKQLEHLKVPELGEEAYNSFIKQIESFKSNKDYQKVLEGLEDEDESNRFIGYFKEKGYPINTLQENKFNEFVKEYFKIDIGKKENKTIEINKEVDKKNKKSDENEDETEKLREKFRIFEKNNVNIVNYKSWKEIEKLINNMDGISKEEFDKKIQKFGDYLLTEIAQSKDIPEQEKRELFESASSFLSQVSPNFTPKSYEFYAGTRYESTSSGLEKIVTSTENSINEPGVLKVDMTHIPPKYNLSILNSDYKFEKRLNAKEVQKSAGEYIEKQGQAREGLKNLDSFGNSFNTFLQDVGNIWQEEDPKDFKDGLDAYVNQFRIRSFSYLSNIYNSIDVPNELKVNEFDISELKNIDRKEDLEEKVNNLQSKIQKLGEYIQSIPIGAYKKYEEEIVKAMEEDKELQERQLETLQFLHSIGFDKIPQSMTDIIIAHINQNVGLSTKLGFTRKIDLANGDLGVDKDFGNIENSLPEKEVFVNLMNKILESVPGGERYKVQLSGKMVMVFDNVEKKMVDLKTLEVVIGELKVNSVINHLGKDENKEKSKVSSDEGKDSGLK